MLKIVGAGVGRTGTTSLKQALERLLNGPCYHMFEVIQNHPEHVPQWQAAAEGNMPDWNKLMAGYVAAVDWPVAAFWQELAEANPDAPILLSVRDADSWWTSASNTIFPTTLQAEGEFRSMLDSLFANRFTGKLTDREASIEAYERHNQHVRDTAPAGRLVEWKPGDGWAPLCEALGVPIPDAPFPHSNTTEDFKNNLAARTDEIV